VWDKRAPIYDCARLEQLLLEHPYPDPTLSANVLNGLENGTGHYCQLPLIDFPSHLRVANANTIDDPANAALIRAAFISNVAKGRMAGPYKRPPYPNPLNPHQPYVARTSCARKGAKWKELARAVLDRAVLEHETAGRPLTAAQQEAITAALGLGKLRPISDSSAPCSTALRAISANARFRGNETIMLYVTTDELIRLLLLAGPGAFIIAFDVKSAYNTLFTRKEDLNAYVQRIFTEEFGEEFFTSLVNTFGTTDSPPAWQAFANVLKWVLETARVLEPLHRMIAHYVDNYWSFLALRHIPPGMSALQIGAALFTLLDSISVEYHETSVATEFEAIGWLFGSSPSPWVAFKPGKRELALVLLESFQTQPDLTVGDLEQAAGFFSWLAQVFKMLKPHLGEIHRLKAVAQGNKLTLRVAPSPAFRLSVGEALRVLKQFPAGSKLALHPGMLPAASPSLVIRTDASGIRHHGLGAVNVTRRVLLCRQWSPDQLAAAESPSTKELSSTCLEAFALLVALQKFIESNSLILCEVDSDDLASAFRKGSSSSAEINLVLSDIVELVSANNSVLRVRQILRDENQTSDCLSHLIKSQTDIDELTLILIDEFGSDAANQFIRNSDLQVHLQ
jgi:hypothetical protein